MTATDIIRNAGPRAARKSGSSEWFHRHGAKIALGLMLFYTLATTLIIAFHSTNRSLVCWHLLACFVCLFLLLVSHRDLLSPRGISVIFYFFAFILPVPFFIAVSDLATNGPTPDELIKTLALSLLGLVCFAIGTIWTLDRMVRPMVRSVVCCSLRLRPVSLLEFLIILLWVATGAAIRLSLGIGMAGVRNSFGYANVAGLLEFLFRDGSIVLIGLFLYRALSAGRIWLIGSFLLASGFVATQLLLGWRSGIKEILIVGFVVFWYQHLRVTGQRRSMVWILVLVCAAPVTISVGNAVRTKRESGFAQEYSEGSWDFVQKITMRMDGHARFAGVLAHETSGDHLSLANGFQFVDLFQEGISTDNYADRYVWGIDPRRVHSMGASGPGGAYIAIGILGIVLGYLFLGTVYRAIYYLVQTLREPTPAVALYGIVLVDLPRLFSENLPLLALGKKYLVPLVVLWLAKQILQARRQPLPGRKHSYGLRRSVLPSPMEQDSRVGPNSALHDLAPQNKHDTLPP